MRLVDFAVAGLATGDAVFVPLALSLEPHAIFFGHFDVTQPLMGGHTIPRPREVLHDLSR